MLTFRGRTPRTDRALVMAIVNRTPDSFYRPGETFDPAVALDAVARALDDGADVIDIGGVRAGDGPDVSEAEEIERTAPFIETVRSRFADAILSIDTWRAAPATAALEAGADLVNDTWAGWDPDLVDATAARGAGLVCSHTGGQEPRTLPAAGIHFDDVVADVIAGTTALAERAQQCGVPAESILIDPTHDFGKTTAHGLELLRRCDELVAPGWPVLMALSRKDFVGETLDLGVEDRLEGTLAATAVAAFAGARMFRTHDVTATRRVLEMVASIRGDRPPAAPLRGL